ncbi:hypothetical protein A7A08_03068 [Methyloligella halotolerans]|uniref:DUF1254 domain-containing protein n=1 Tax=Methyloligella halotolerans TaxID=1177755 RepID=A0A1E2RV01_9HYPH|nr:DUF1254 domain-containing protein [Methyloligella halotolerans]ODA66054.1 hypothetical protein A7A08_03068 [Methyloligella halotolerans]
MKSALAPVAAIAALFCVVATQSVAKAEDSTAENEKTIDTRIGPLTFESGYPSRETVQKLYDEMDFQRAAQAYIWGIPAVGLNEWRRAHYVVFGGKSGEMLNYFDFAEKLGILTPNYTTPYIATFIDLRETGPFVIEVPAGLIAGMILDNWQRVLADLGVVGPDMGRGGKYLILPPGYGPVEADGYFVVEATSRDVLAGFRLLGDDKEQAIAELVPQIKTYSWGPEGTGEPMVARAAGEKKWSQMPPHGMAYWDSLNEVIQRNPVDERDRLTLAQLKFLGIEKGKSFKPDARQKKILEDGVVVGEAMAKVNTTDKRVEPPFWKGTNWKHALVVATDQKANTYDQLDERAAWFYEAVVISKAMLTQTPGVGQRYIASYKDADGNWLSGQNTYKLHVPPNPPAKGFWSVTAYDEGTRQMQITEQGRPDISSRKEDIAKNDDGSIDVYFGPKAPKGHLENWVQTNPDKGWFAYFRFYGPTEAFFDKSWSLPDITKVE